jgi:ComF family protein
MLDFVFMMKELGPALLSLVFPNVCESCAAVVPPSSNGVCALCAARIRLIAPPHCARCGRTLRADGATCGDCGAETFHFDRAFACVYYEGKVKELLRAYKFGGRKTLLGFFTRVMARFIDASMREARFDTVIAVPLDRQKESERGFNQARPLAVAVAKKLALPHDLRALKRTRSTTPQSTLGKKDRLVNIRGRFFVKPGHTLGGRRVLLVDDVLTTGQTASECARVLKEAGASSVTVLALARGH